MMFSLDFDSEVQKHFNKAFSDIKKTNWQKWLDLTTREEYEELVLKNSGLSSIENLFERLQKEKSNSRDLSIDINHFISENTFSKPLILCHTSGTTNSKIKALKWFHMSKEVVQRYWAPGMQAIFESSGLDSNSTAVIFVPSRMKFDGIKINDEAKYVSLYSSEFSQRVMISIIRPKSYLLYEYKNSKNLEVISKILSLEDVSVISAPAATVLSWAHLDKFIEGIKRSYDHKIKKTNSDIENIINIIEKEGISSACRKIQQRLSDKLSNATLIFSITSLSENEWSLIRKFMKWEKGKEKFTNLYVVSEIGPFAASITKEDYEISRLNKMYVFPLTLPFIEYKNRRKLISEVRNKMGKLLVSRLHNSKAIINIDLGDVISVSGKQGLPLIDGKIIRSCFELKYPVKITNEIKPASSYSIYAGDYFPLEDFNIIEPRKFIHCMNRICSLKSDSILLINDNEDKWNLFIAPANFDEEKKQIEIYNKIFDCSDQTEFIEAMRQNNIKIKLINESPVDFIKPRAEILNKVRNGDLPKGILKKWPLYLLRTKIKERNKHASPYHI